jgi:hypothetical protein
VVAGKISVVTGRVWVSVSVTVLEGRVSVTAGRVSVTVTGGLAGSSVAVSIGTVVCVWASVGDVVVVVRVRPGSDDVIAVESPPLPLPHPAVASATITPRRPAVA